MPQTHMRRWVRSPKSVSVLIIKLFLCDRLSTRNLEHVNLWGSDFLFTPAMVMIVMVMMIAMRINAMAVVTIAEAYQILYCIRFSPTNCTNTWAWVPAIGIFPVYTMRMYIFKAYGELSARSIGLACRIKIRRDLSSIKTFSVHFNPLNINNKLWY